MPKPRSYKLLCPIARALDRIGDRWTLLILRDLHAGPARFSELQKGLVGIAANLLTDRLAKLTDDGLIERREAAHGVSVYDLTDLGRRTDDIIFELAKLGAGFAPETAPVKPGNLRTVTTTLGLAARRAATAEMRFTAEMVVDGERMALVVDRGHVRATYGPAMGPDLVLTTDYNALLAVSEGEMTLENFTKDHSQLETNNPKAAQEFGALMANIMSEVFQPE